MVRSLDHLSIYFPLLRLEKCLRGRVASALCEKNWNLGEDAFVGMVGSSVINEAEVFFLMLLEAQCQRF